MSRYPAENWKALGSWVSTARRAAGLGDTSAWASAVGRSSRIVLGLERGEPVGDKTLQAVAQGLKLAGGAALLYEILASGKAPADVTIHAPAATAHLDLSGSVGGKTEDGSYVASPGARTESGVSNDEVLQELRDMQRRLEELSERLADHAKRSAEPLGGTSGPSAPETGEDGNT